MVSQELLPLRLTAQVLGGAPAPEPYELLVLKDGEPLTAAPVAGDDFRLPFASTGPGRYRLQLQRGSVIEGVSSPIYVERAGGAGRPETPGSSVPGGRRRERARRDEEPERRRREQGATQPTPRREAVSDAESVDDPLAFTGGRIAPLAALGLSLLAAGIVLRRRRLTP